MPLFVSVHDRFTNLVAFRFAAPGGVTPPAVVATRLPPPPTLATASDTGAYCAPLPSSKSNVPAADTGFCRLPIT